jgi:hypothetical protein
MAFVLEDLGGDVVGSAAYGFFFLAVVLEFGGETEVSQFDFHILIDK